MKLWADHVLPHLVERVCRSAVIAEKRARWIPRAQGRVLEVGIGSGLNLPFYDRARITQLTGLDPSAALLARAAARAQDRGFPVELLPQGAEAIPLPDGSFDSAVVTYSLCSVRDPARVLSELHRVLAPGGELIFVEHGLAPDARPSRWQRRLTPLWRQVSGNCHLDRPVFVELSASRFSLEDAHEGYAEGPRWLSYLYEGVARRID